MPKWKLSKSWSLLSLEVLFQNGKGVLSKEVFFSPLFGEMIDFSLKFLGCKFPPKVFGIMWPFFGSWIVVLIENLVIAEMLGTLKVWYEFTISTQLWYISIPSRCFYLSQVLCDIFYSKRWICIALPYFDGWFATAPPIRNARRRSAFQAEKKGLNSLLGLAVSRSCLGQLRTGHEADNVMWNL